MVFGKKSRENLSTCHVDLQLVANTAIAISMVDFAINEGNRSEEKQLEYFLQGYSRIDPRVPRLKKLGKHLYNPSLAFDVRIYVPGKPKLAYDKIHLAYVGGVIMTVGQILLNQGDISHKLRYGGNWDSDGELLYDQSLQDLPHFELII